jgi:hypothetical protein
MRGSLVHDALYQLMRREPGKLPASEWRDEADSELRRICRRDGMSRVWAWVVYQGVHRFGEPATSPEERVLTSRIATSNTNSIPFPDNGLRQVLSL